MLPGERTHLHRSALRSSARIAAAERVNVIDRLEGCEAHLDVVILQCRDQGRDCGFRARVNTSQLRRRLARTAGSLSFRASWSAAMTSGD